MASVKKVNVGGIIIGGGADVAIQSMLSVRSDDTRGNIQQASALEKEGCDIIRVAIPDFHSVKLIDKLKENINIAQLHLWDAAKAVLVRKCLTLNAYIRKKVLLR